jgi:hypothetical protein
MDQSIDFEQKTLVTLLSHGRPGSSNGTSAGRNPRTSASRRSTTRVGHAGRPLICHYRSTGGRWIAESRAHRERSAPEANRKKNRPNTMYKPPRTKGTPHSLKNTGPPLAKTVVSQKIANPHHRRLNGIINAAAARNRIHCFGRPLHSNRSPRIQFVQFQIQGCATCSAGEPLVQPLVSFVNWRNCKYCSCVILAVNGSPASRSTSGVALTQGVSARENRSYE